MSFIEPILAWFARILLEILASRAMKEIEKQSRQIAIDRERRKINEENLIKYEQAFDRKEKIARAVDLLNGLRRP